MYSMTEFPTLFTPRLILRKITIDDVPSLVKYADNKKITDRIINFPYPFREPDGVFRISNVLQGFKTKTRFVFSIILKERAELIGEISIHLERNNTAQLGYWIGEPFWNQGMVTEAVGAVLQFGFEKLELQTIFATCDADNPGSERVLVKNGMEQHYLAGNVLQYKKENVQ